MAQNKVVTRTYEDVVSRTAEDAGMPKKQITETIEAFSKTIKSELADHQPKRDGDVLNVESPFVKYVATRVGEQVITDAEGKKFTRPPCIALNCALPTDYIHAANVGMFDDAAIEKDGISKKKA